MNTLDFIKLSLATRGGLAIELMTFTEVCNIILSEVNYIEKMQIWVEGLQILSR